MFTDPDL